MRREEGRDGCIRRAADGDETRRDERREPETRDLKSRTSPYFGAPLYLQRVTTTRP